MAEDLARPVADFCRAHPNVRLTLVNHVGLRTLDLLLSGDADLAVLPAGTDVVAYRQFLTAEPLCERDWVAAVPEGHPLERKRRLGLADLVRYPLILPEQGSGWRQQLDDVFRTAGLLSQVQVALEVSMTLAVRRFVSLGGGIAVLPLPTDAIAFPGVTMRPLGNLLPREEVVALWRRGSPSRPQARLFIDFVRERLAAGKG
jgi:DNA-binding transcriptional LysR family regulator